MATSSGRPYSVLPTPTRIPPDSPSPTVERMDMPTFRGWGSAPGSAGSAPGSLDGGGGSCVGLGSGVGSGIGWGEGGGRSGALRTGGGGLVTGSGGGSGSGSGSGAFGRGGVSITSKLTTLSSARVSIVSPKAPSRPAPRSSTMEACSTAEPPSPRRMRARGLPMTEAEVAGRGDAAFDSRGLNLSVGGLIDMLDVDGETGYPEPLDRVDESHYLTMGYRSVRGNNRLQRASPFLGFGLEGRN